MLVVNFFLVDKPFRFFSTASQPEFDDDNVSVDVADSFDSQSSAADGQGVSGGSATSSIPAYGGSGAGSNASGKLTDDDTIIRDREEVFPSLTAIDEKYEGFELPAAKGDDIPLKELAEKFRLYLAKTQKLYFDIDTIRFFISGFAASHFEILEGLSGTGKSSLPRYFAEFIGANVLFLPVQATWRDKTSILGFYNEFSKTYTETDFLSALYEANYSTDTINFYVLDEMNISRVEYYFADLLSVLEYPVADIAILAKDSLFWPQLKNTFILWGYSLCFGFITPIIQALFLNEIKGKPRSFARYLYVLPAAVPGVAGLAVWRYIWNPDSGIANMIIGFFGVKPQTWLLDEKLIKLTLSLPGLLGGGLNLLVYLIAIEGVSPELYEAASLDGATRFKSLIFITLPQITYMISIQLLLSISGSLLAFDTPYIMTDGSGGPNGAATTVVFGIYNKAYTELQYGQAMATSIVLLIIMLAMNFIKQAFEKKFGDD